MVIPTEWPLASSTSHAAFYRSVVSKHFSITSFPRNMVHPRIATSHVKQNRPIDWRRRDEAEYRRNHSRKCDDSSLTTPPPVYQQSTRLMYDHDAKETTKRRKTFKKSVKSSNDEGAIVSTSTSTATTTTRNAHLFKIPKASVGLERTCKNQGASYRLLLLEVCVVGEIVFTCLLSPYLAITTVLSFSL